MSDWLKRLLMIPALVAIGTAAARGSPFFCCRVCGQQWYEDWEQLKFGGNTYVRKAP